MGGKGEQANFDPPEEVACPYLERSQCVRAP